MYLRDVNRIRRQLKPISYSGGLIYHLKACFSAQRNQWSLFKTELHQALVEFNFYPSQSFSKQNRLLLIGPSGAYTLPDEILSSKLFAEVVCIDPDPIAYFLWKKKYKEINFIWIFNSFLQVNPSQSKELKEAFSHVLFCNLLGQLTLESLSIGEEIGNWISALKNVAIAQSKEIKILSYHDRLSGNLKPWGKNLGKLGPYFSKNEDLINQFYLDIHGELNDHDTENLLQKIFPHKIINFKVLKAFYLIWKITRKQIHLIEVLPIE